MFDLSQDAVIVKLDHFTTSRSHNYRKGDLVPCRFDTLGMNAKGWRAVTQRELDDAAPPKKKKKG